MALWQVTLMFVNKNKLSGFQIDDISEFIDEMIIWRENEINTDSVRKISEIFPLEVSWSECIEQYGKIDNTCIKLFRYDDGSGNIEVNCRLDICTLSELEGMAVLDFINTNDGVILFDGKIYEATLDNLKKIITTSPAYRFCKNPTEFFEGLAKEKSDIEE